MKKISGFFLAAAIITLTSSFLVAEEEKDDFTRAITESGEHVILYSDGTWEFEESAGEAPLPNRTVNPQKFLTPQTAKDVLKGKEISYQLFYDSKKWQKPEEGSNDNAEFSLIHADKNVYAMVIPENVSVPLENLRNIVISNARAASKNVSILSEEERNVNGQKVIMLNIKADIEGMSFVYLYYIYSGENSAIQLICFTTEELFSEYRKDMEDLLNGFVLVKKEVKK